jgi:hypothetical protein
MLPLLFNLLLKEDESDICGWSLLRLGLKIDFDDSFIDEDDKRDVKQTKSSLVLLLLLVVR